MIYIRAVSLAPFPNFTVSIDINDILTVGGFQAAGSLLLSIIAFFSAVALLFPQFHHHTENRKGVQPFAIGCWIFGLVWTFGTAAATTVYGVNRSAKNAAFVDGTALPPNVVRYVIFLIPTYTLSFFFLLSAGASFDTSNRVDWTRCGSIRIWGLGAHALHSDGGNS